MKILIVQLSSLGDILQMCRATFALAQALPTAHLSWAVEKRFAALVRAFPWIHEVIPLDIASFRNHFPSVKSWNQFKEMKRALQKEKYDWIIDFQGSIKSSFVTFFAKANRKIGYDFQSVYEWPNLFVTNSRYRPKEALSPFDRSMNFLSEFVLNASFSLDSPLYLKEPFSKKKWEEWIGQSSLPLVILMPHSRWTKKSFKDWREILPRVSAPFRLAITFGNEEEEKTSRSLAASCSQPVELLGNLSLDELQFLMRQAKLVLGVDSGLLYLAALAHCPTISLYGPTYKGYYAPQGKKHSSFQGTCPYDIRFDKRCPYFRKCEAPCRNAFSHEDLIKEIEKYLLPSLEENS